MKFKIIIVGLSLIYLMTAPAFAQNIDTLISDYRQAVVEKNTQKMKDMAVAIQNNQSALSYLKANDPDLYQKMQPQTPAVQPIQDGSILQTGVPSKTVTASTQPSPEVLSEAAVDKNVKKETLKPTKKKGQHKVWLEQAKTYERQLREEMKKTATVMTVSGLPREDRKVFLELLKKELNPSVNWVMENKFDQGFAEYWFELKPTVDLQKFAYSLDNRRVDDKYELDLTSFNKEKVDYILKLH